MAKGASITADEAYILSYIFAHPFHDQKTGLALIGDPIPAFVFAEGPLEFLALDKYLQARPGLDSDLIFDNLQAKGLIICNVDDNGENSIALTGAGYNVVRELVT